MGQERALRLAVIAGLPVIDLITVIDRASTAVGERNVGTGRLTSKQAAGEQLAALLDGTELLPAGSATLWSWKEQPQTSLPKQRPWPWPSHTNHVIDLIRVQEPLIMVTVIGSVCRKFDQGCGCGLQNRDQCHFYQETLVLEGIVPTAKAKERAGASGACFLPAGDQFY